MKIKLSLFVFLLFIFAMHAQPVLPTLPAGRMLNYWRCDDTNWLSLFGTGPRSAVNVELTEGVDANGVRFAGLFAAQLPCNLVEPTGRTNLTLQNGSLRFWFRPDFDSGTGPGSYARLLDVGARTTDGSYGWWSLYLDPAGTNLFFSAQANGQGSNFLAASVQWSAWEWHQIALTYSPRNSTFYVDGSAVAEGTGVTLTPGGRCNSPRASPSAATPRAGIWPKAVSTNSKRTTILSAPN